jgi:hypothetical protein
MMNLITLAHSTAECVLMTPIPASASKKKLFQRAPRAPPHLHHNTVKMFHLLPATIITTIFDCTNSFTTATRLSQCSKHLSNIWKSHLETLDLANTFDSDPRWRSEKYRFFAVSIVRAQLEAAGSTSPLFTPCQISADGMTRTDPLHQRRRQSRLQNRRHHQPCRGRDCRRPVHRAPGR